MLLVESPPWVRLTTTKLSGEPTLTWTSKRPRIGVNRDVPCYLPGFALTIPSDP